MAAPAPALSADVEVLSRLCAEQARLINKLMSGEVVVPSASSSAPAAASAAAMKEDILKALREEMGLSEGGKEGAKRKTKKRRPRPDATSYDDDLPPSPTSSGGQDEGDDQYVLRSSSTAAQGLQASSSSFVRTTSAGGYSLGGQPSVSTSSSSSRPSQQRLPQRVASRLQASPLAQPLGPAADGGLAPVKAAAKPRRQRAAEAGGAVPLSPFGQESKDEGGAGAVVLEDSTSRMLAKSAALVGEATGRDARKILMNTMDPSSMSGLSRTMPNQQLQPQQQRQQMQRTTSNDTLEHLSGQLSLLSVDQPYRPPLAKQSVRPPSRELALSSDTLSRPSQQSPPLSALRSTSSRVAGATGVLFDESPDPPKAQAAARDPKQRPPPPSSGGLAGHLFSTTSSAPAETMGISNVRRPQTVGAATIASVRAEASSLGAKLLGPLNLDGKMDKAPLPDSLSEGEWENELARNILSLYSNKVVKDLRDKKERIEEEGRRKAARRARQTELMNANLSDAEIDAQLKSWDASVSAHGLPAVVPALSSSSLASRRMQRLTKSSGELNAAGNKALEQLLDGVDLGAAELNKVAARERGDERPTFDEAIRRIGDSAVASAAGSRVGRGTATAASNNDATTNNGKSFTTTKEQAEQKKAIDRVVVAPVRPRAIWFGGTGAILAEWGALEEFTMASPTLRKDLEALQEKGMYTTYVAMVEGLLAAAMRVQADTETTELLERLWRQMVVTCNAFGVRCLEQKKYANALELFEKAMELAAADLLPPSVKAELKAFVLDSYAYYYMKRNKCAAAMQYITNAMKAHARREDWSHVAKCHLHTSVILSKLDRHDESIRCLGQVLSLVDNGSLDVGANNAQQLLLVAVAYHNIAVEQLILRHVSEACVSSQNARRLARLCLSYSNRYLPNFEATHVTALKELAMSVRYKQNDEQHEIFEKLAKALYE